MFGFTGVMVVCLFWVFVGCGCWFVYCVAVDFIGLIVLRWFFIGLVYLLLIICFACLIVGLFGKLVYWLLLVSLYLLVFCWLLDCWVWFWDWSYVWWLLLWVNGCWFIVANFMHRLFSVVRLRLTGIITGWCCSRLCWFKICLWCVVCLCL